MCIICTEWNKVSPREIARGALELSEEHFDEVLDKIQQEDKKVYEKVVDELFGMMSYASKNS